MLDAVILLLATAVSYSYLHLRGGQRFAPASSLKGKRERTILWGLLGIIAVSITSMLMGQEAGDRASTVVIPLIIGIIIFLVFYLKGEDSR